MKKIIFLCLSTLLVLSLSACNRTRRNNIDTSPAAPTNTQPPAVEPTQTLFTEVTEAPTSAPVPVQSEPTATLVPTQSPSAAATASAELNQTLAELEQLLNNMDTNIDVP